MSLSRLAGLVSLLVVGTLMTVWWYLQVPAGDSFPASPQVEAQSSVQVGLDGDLADGSASGALRRSEETGTASAEASKLALRRASALRRPSLPASLAPASSERWVRRVPNEPGMHTAQARAAALQGMTPAQYFQGTSQPCESESEACSSGASVNPAATELP